MATINIPILQIKKLRLRKELIPSHTANGSAQIYQSALLSPGEICPAPLAPHLQDFALGTLQETAAPGYEWVSDFAATLVFFLAMQMPFSSR